MYFFYLRRYCYQWSTAKLHTQLTLNTLKRMAFFPVICYGFILNLRARPSGSASSLIARAIFKITGVKSLSRHGVK